jgi:hypothetical protein
MLQGQRGNLSYGHFDRSGEICSRMEVNYRPQPDVSTVLDMTKKIVIL